MAVYKGKDAVKRLAANIQRRRQAAKRELARGIFRDLVERTPVDTGVARADWRMRAREPDDSPALEPRPDLRGQSTPIDPPPLPPLPKRLALHQPIYITNPQAYIQYLEKGTSSQAPLGMVRITLDEWSGSRLAEEIEKIRVEFERDEYADPE